MRNRNKNNEVSPKHQKQIHEKKKQNVLWIQKNIGNKFIEKIEMECHVCGNHIYGDPHKRIICRNCDNSIYVPLENTDEL
jgi:NAD-dependent dihydropyrimidine dehydrogenase PreA subunit